MNKTKIILTSLVLFFCVSSAMAQQRRITGYVYDDMGGVMMANVVERDNNNRIVEAAVTDINGNFSMVIKNPKDKLVVSYIGYKTWSQVIGNTTKFNIRLQDNTQLQEVVVQAKPKVQSNGMSIPLKEISVATQTMNMDEVEGLSFASADEALQGKIAGLDIVANSGNVGAGTSMRLRGVSSIHGSAEPLIVVDGNIFELPADVQKVDFENLDNEEQFSTLLSISPEDIKDIKVLKDAAATAIWGSKGANGVLEITTRRGTPGKTRINFSYKFTGSWSPEGLNMLNGDGYTMMLKEAYFNPKQNPNSSDMVELNYDRSMPTQYYNFNKNTDWVDAVNQFGQTHDYTIALNGGGEKARFRISGGYYHQTGTIIQQTLDRFNTRLVLDYDVSDRIRFSSNFALTYTDWQRNWDGSSTSSILGKAYDAMPNMSIYEYDQNGYTTGDYYKMLPTNPTTGASGDNYYSSNYLSDMKAIGNPVAIAHQAFNNQSTYRIIPQFNLRYKLLSKDDEGHQLDLNAEVYMDIYNQSENSYYPASLTTDSWDKGVNTTSNNEYKSLAFTNREKLIFVPHFNTDVVTASVMGQFEFTTGNGTSQNIGHSGVPTGITSSVASAYLTGAGSGTSQWRGASMLASAHIAFYDGRYSFDATLRRDGSTRFGAGRKWGNFPGLSVRWNINQEPFFEGLHIEKIVSMLAFRSSWGKNGNPPAAEYLMYNKYKNTGSYGTIGEAIAPESLRLTDLKWETTTAWNIGANLNLFNDLLQFDFNYYNRQTDNVLMGNFGVAGTSGYNSLTYKNDGGMRNHGWELYVNTGKFLKRGKFSMSATFNFAQNFQTITDMDPTVLANINKDFTYKNATAGDNYLKRIQVNNALGSFYGFRYKGVYRYDYEHSGYTQLSRDTYGDKTAAAAAERGENATAPIVRDAAGNIIYDSKGNPLHMYFNYGGQNYEFQGGDVIYEDINHDGQINELDIVYLGNSLPTITGGFGLNFNYGQWTLKLSFNYRMGNKIANVARLLNESMLTNKNQSQAVAWRWRKNGDITEIPRAMNEKIGPSYNSLASDRYIEKGDFLRLQYMQLGYSLPNKVCKDLGVQSLRISASANNLFVLTKYTGIDPEVSYSQYSMCIDNSKTPRAKSVTLSVNLGF